MLNSCLLGYIPIRQGANGVLVHPPNSHIVSGFLPDSGEREQEQGSGNPPAAPAGPDPPKENEDPSSDLCSRENDLSDFDLQNTPNLNRRQRATPSGDVDLQT